MNEIIFCRTLFFIVLILLAVSIITVAEVASLLVSRFRLKDERRKKSKISRKRNAAAVSGRNHEKPLPAATILTIDNCWLHRI